MQSTTDNDYDQLRSWYLARLRKLAHDAESARSLTPASLIIADRTIVEKLIAQRAAEDSQKKTRNKKGQGKSGSAPIENLLHDKKLQATYALILAPALFAIVIQTAGTFALSTQAGNYSSLACQSLLTTTVISTLGLAVGILLIHSKIIVPLQKCQLILREVLTEEAKLRLAKMSTFSALELACKEVQVVTAESGEREKAIADYALNVILSLDSKGVIIDVSPACLREWGFLPEELIGRTIKVLIQEDEIENFHRGLTHLQSTKSALTMETSMRAKNNTSLDMRWSMEWSETRQISFCIVENITPQKTLERVKQEFVSMISHDLKTPINSLGLLLEMLARGVYGPISDEAKRLVEISNRSVWRLLDLINQLLDLDKLDAGKFDLSISSVPIKTIVERAIDEVAGMSQQKSIKIEYDGGEVMVDADSDRLVQVVSNLLSNAIKYSPTEGKIQIVSEIGTDSSLLSIADEGPGVPEAKRISVFDRFSQVNREDAIERKGTGLGLAICRAIVEAHGGHIGVNCSDSGGSTFWFRIPRSTKR